jgi:tetratricopeptide (TPR) repeat protein
MSDALLWNEIGNLYLHFGSFNEAIAAIRRAFELEPNSAMFSSNLGQAYYKAGEFDNALLLFQKSIQLLHSPREQAVIWNKIGDTCRALKDLDSAMRAYKKADDLVLVAGAPGQGRKTPAVSPVNRQAASKPAGNPDPAALLTGLKKLVSQMEQSVEEPTQVEPEPSAPQIDAPQAFSIEDTQPSRSIHAAPVVKDGFQSAVEPPAASNDVPASEPGSEVTHKNIYVYPDPNATNEDKAVKTPARDTGGSARGPVSHFPNLPNLQEILAKMRVYENITRTNPTNDRAWDTLGKLYKSLGRYKDAIASYLRAIDIAPTRDIYFYYLGLLYSVEGKHDLAVEAFETVLQRNPDYVLAHGALAGVYHRMGLENKANHHIAIALPMMESESAYNRACFHAICGDNEQALEFLQQALKNQDTTVEWIKSDPDLEPLRTDPRYLTLIAEIDKQGSEKEDENFFSSTRKGKENRVLPLLNNSVAR